MLGAAAIALAASAAVIGEREAFRALETPGRIAALPGVTVDDDPAIPAMPIVTSLRSDCQAERRGLRVGDHIAAVDGHPVRDAEEMRRAIEAGGAGRPVALHVRRGNALWAVAIDGAGAHDP